MGDFDDMTFDIFMSETQSKAKKIVCFIRMFSEEDDNDDNDDDDDDDDDDK